MKKLLFIFLIPFFSFAQSGDTNGDGIVNLEDLFNVLENWLEDVNDNDPEAISNLDEMTALVDSLITLNHNINYGLTIEGWVDNDFQSTWNEADLNINIAQSSGIVYVSDDFNEGESISGCVGNYTGAVVNDELIMENNNTTHRGFSFPVKKYDEFIIWGGCSSQIDNDIFIENNSIKFFSFGDSNILNNSQSNSNNSLSDLVNYVVDYSFDSYMGIDCEGLDSLELGTIVNDAVYATHYMVSMGKKCGGVSSENMFTPSGNPNNDASSTAYYLSRRNVLYCFTVNDTIAIDAPGLPSSTICGSGGISYLTRYSNISDSYINFDPNTDYQPFTTMFPPAGSILFPGVLYLWEHGNVNCGSTNANLVVVAPNLNNNDIFNQVSIWVKPLDESTWSSANYITNTYGLYFYEFGKYLKILN